MAVVGSGNKYSELTEGIVAEISIAGSGEFEEKGCGSMS
jgi:hypothetical protein